MEVLNGDCNIIQQVTANEHHCGEKIRSRNRTRNFTVYKNVHENGSNNDSIHQQFSEHVQLTLSSRSVSTIIYTTGVTRTKVYY
jgi:hypothetical protein